MTFKNRDSTRFLTWKVLDAIFKIVKPWHNYFVHDQYTVNISHLTCPCCSSTPREGQTEFTAEVFSD